MEKKKNGSYSTGERVTLIVFAISVALYLLNILLGKASIHWGWDVFILEVLVSFYCSCLLRSLLL